MEVMCDCADIAKAHIKDVGLACNEALLIRHAGDILSKVEVKEGGKTAYENLKERPYRGSMVEFGRQVLYFIAGRRGGDLRPRWAVGTWLGKDRRSDEHVLAIAGGKKIDYSRAIKLLPDEQS